jgi:hypothetical protein
VTLLGLALAWFGVSPARDPRVVGARGLAWMVPVGVALLVGDPSLPFFVRYFVVLVPLACVAAAAGLANGSAALTARHIWAGALARALVTVALASAVWASIPSSNATPENGWTVIQSDVARVGAVTGWTLPEIAGRLVVISRRDAKPSWRAMEGVEYLLHQRGEAFAGSKAPPCGVLFREDVSSQAPDVLLRDALVFEADQARLIDVTLLGNGSTLLRYDGVSRCPTSLVDRYVPPPEFAPMEALALTHPQAGAVARSVIPGGTRFYTSLEFPGFTRPEDISTRLHLFVDLARVDGALIATLSSEQLRGEAHLRGWFVSGLIHAPTLRLEGADHRVEQVSFSDGFVGMRAASTPLSVALPGMVEPVQVTLSFDLFGLGDESAWPPADLRGAPTSVLLDPAWSAPPAADAREPSHGG